VAVPRFRLSRNYGRFYAGHTHDLAFRVYRWDDTPTVRAWVPEALGGYTSVRFQVYETDASPSCLKDVPLTVQTGPSDLEDGVANKVTGTVLFAAAVSSARCKVVLQSTSVYRVVDAEWEADVYVGGPTS